MTVSKGSGNRKRTCKHCGKTKRAHEGIIVQMNFYCDFDCASKRAVELNEKKKSKDKAKENKAAENNAKKARAAHREKKKSLRKTSEWQKILRSLVQQYVKYVVYQGEGCCTCTNPNPTEAGHYKSVGSRPDLQFELTNIHMQCHECNVHKSSNASEYDKFILAKYGQDHYDKLNSNNWASLKEQFPHWTDYEKEIKRYRKLLRENGIKPRK